MRIGQHDRQIEGSDLFDPGGTGHLAVAVEGVPTGGTRPPQTVAPARQNCGDTGSHRTAAHLERTVALDQRDFSDLEAGHVGDGVERAGPTRQPDAEPAGTWSSVGGVCLR